MTHAEHNNAYLAGYLAGQRSAFAKIARVTEALADEHISELRLCKIALKIQDKIEDIPQILYNKTRSKEGHAAGALTLLGIAEGLSDSRG